MNLKTLVAQAAEAKGLPADLVYGIVLTESGGVPWAARYEPGFDKLLRQHVEKGGKIQHASVVTYETEFKSRATSYGLMQIMGQVARERGFQGAFLTELCDPAVGLDLGTTHLKYLEGKLFQRYGWDGVIAAYNGGVGVVKSAPKYPNMNYVQKVKANADKWQR